MRQKGKWIRIIHMDPPSFSKCLDRLFIQSAAAAGRKNGSFKDDVLEDAPCPKVDLSNGRDDGIDSPGMIEKVNAIVNGADVHERCLYVDAVGLKTVTL